MTRTRRGAAFAGVIAVTAVLAFPSSAAEGCVGLEVSPARLARDGSRRTSYDVIIRNCTDQTLRVTASEAGLAHDLDGVPEFLASSAAEAALATSGTGTFALEPGRRRKVAVTATIPGAARSLYGAIVAEFEQMQEIQGATVEARSRVATMLLMRGPRPWQEAVKVVDIGLTPLEDGSYTIHAAVKNTGNVHVEPTGRVEVRQGGAVLDTVPLDGGIVLPGYKRRLTGHWVPPRDLDGRIKLTAHITGPAATGTTTIDFTEGETAAPAARIVSLIASDDDGALLSVTVQNVGNVALTPNIEMVIGEDEFERARQNFPQTDALDPGETRVVDWRPSLDDGTYLITARATQDGALLDEKVTSLRLGAPPSVEERSARGRWLVTAAILLVLVLAVLLWFVGRRRRGEIPLPVLPDRELTRTGAR